MATVWDTGSEAYISLNMARRMTIWVGTLGLVVILNQLARPAISLVVIFGVLTVAVLLHLLLELAKSAIVC
jgi:hypothetical protein